MIGPRSVRGHASGALLRETRLACFSGDECLAMRWGFHLANLPHHEWAAIAQPLVQMGYRGVAVRASARWRALDDAATARWIDSFSVFRDHGLEIVIDADGKFVVDPWDAHAPRLARACELVSRESLLLRWIDLARQIGCGLVTFSVGSGKGDEDTEAVLQRLAPPITRLVERASGAGIQLAIKAEVGSVIETASHFHRLQQWLPDWIASHRALGWVADIAVMARRGELPIGDRLQRDADCLRCVYLSDVAAGVAGDMRFGTGDLAIRRIVAALEDMRYGGPLILRCEGYADAGLALAKEAMQAVGGNGPAVS
ncbi:MAG: sugar phosphate isomerase/epimerase family protein [Planctomycetaceae bacterium]